MGRRFLYRFLMIIPVTLSILLVTLFLFYQLPGTRVFDSEQIELGSDRELEHILWEQEERNPFLKAHGLFYFSIHAGYIPDSIYLVPLVFRHSFKALSKDVQQPGLMNEYAVWIRNEVKGLKSRETSQVSSKQLIHMLSATSVQEFGERMDSWSAGQDDYPPVWMEILTSEKKETFSFIRFRWNGGHNTFHYYLKALLTGQPALETLSGERVKNKFFRTVRWTLAYSLPVLLIGWGVVFLFVVYFYDRGVLLARIDRGIVLLYSFPTFVLATLALVFLTSHRYGLVSHLFPFPIFLETKIDHLGAIYQNYSSQLLLPMLLFAISPMILFYRVFYEKIEDIKKMQPSYRYLRHAGLSASVFRIRYLSKHLFVATWALLSNLFVAVLGGSMIIELIFNIPGLGRFLYDSIVNYDIGSTVFLIVIFTIVQQAGHLWSDFMIEYFFAPKGKATRLL